MTTFNDLIGHKDIVQQLKTTIDSNLLENKPLPHLLLIGPHGCGKTKISKSISNYTGFPIVTANAAAISDGDSLVNLLSDHLESESKYNRVSSTPKPRRLKYPILESLNDLYYEEEEETVLGPEIVYKLKNKQLIVYLDEAQGISKKLQTLLLTLLTDGQIFCGKGKNLVKHFFGDTLIFIASTTDGGALSGALKRRFITFILSYPNQENKKTIIKNNLADNISNEDIQKLSLVCVSQDDCVKIAARIREYCKKNKWEFEAFLAYLGLDPNGLDLLHRSALDYLAQRHGAVSVQCLATRLCLSRKDCEALVEPKLIRAGLMVITAKGRQITQAGKNTVEGWTLNE